MFEVRVEEPDQLAGLSDAELIDAARAAARAENAICARKLAVMAEIFIRRTDLPADDREHWWVDPDAAVAAELAAAQNITRGLALHQTERGVALRDRLPHVFALFLAGVISEALVRAIVSRTELITDPDLMAAVDGQLAAEIAGWGALSIKKTQLAIDAIVERHDKDALRVTQQHGTGRTVEFGNPADAPGYTSLYARLLAGDAAVSQKVLYEMIYSVCADDPRTVEERRNDAIAALLTGIPDLACACGQPDCEAATKPRPTRNTTIYLLTDTPPGKHDDDDADDADEGDANAPDEAQTEPEAPTETEHHTAAGPADRGPDDTSAPPKRAPAQCRSGFIFGAGLMPAPLLEELLDGARIRKVRHPGPTTPEPRRHPSRALIDYIRCRDLTCRFPGCDHPATDCDIDHTVPYPIGPTHPSNLKALCRFHHLLKTFWGGVTGWRDRQHPDGTVKWISPTGHTYTTYPGSRMLFPALCAPTATLWTGDPPPCPTGQYRGKRMPRRRNTRAHNRTRAINAERRRNTTGNRPDPSDDLALGRALLHYDPYDFFTPADQPIDYGDDPPPF